MTRNSLSFVTLGPCTNVRQDELLSLLFGGNIEARPFNPMKSGGFRGKKAPEGAAWAAQSFS